jgi:dihydrofolate reductase
VLIRARISISLDGYASGPNQRPEEPLGDGGERLHEWMFGDAVHDIDARVLEETEAGVGAYVMGRNMFAGPGEWEPSWRGWWGENPPYHAPVFVLTHQQRDPIPMDGGTTFHFVTDGIESALEQARAAANGDDVMVAGGASTIRQYLAAGLLDELFLHIAPILLGAGERPLDDAGDPHLEPVEVVASPAVTHIRYRVGR